MKLYISDLDGTLLTNKGTLSGYSRNKLNELIYSGIHFTVASARSVVTMQKVIEGVRLNLPVIGFNGAFISDLQTGRHHVINDLDASLARDIYDLIIQTGNHSFVSTFNGKKDCLNCPECFNDGMKWYYNDRIRNKDPRLRKPDRMNKVFDENVVCLTVINKKEHLTELISRMQEKCAGQIEMHLLENQYQPGWHWLTVHDIRASKDQAIKTLTAEYGFDIKDLTVFGDNINDLKMFKIAPHAIAVGNAIEELKEHASEVIGSNEEDSVVRYIWKKHTKIQSIKSI